MASPISADHRISNKVWQKRAKYMLDTGLYADVQISVKDSVKGVKTFAAHSLYLKWASPVFERMLEGNFKESSYVMEFENCPEAFQALMTFIYLDHVDIHSSKLAWDLYDIAHKYDIKRLDVLCTDYIEKNLDAQTVWLAVVRSQVYELEKIEKLSYDFIVTKTAEALSADDFVDLEESVIGFLLDQNSLNIPEAILFNFVEMWIREEMKRKGGNEKAKKSLIQRLLPKIHFFEMTPQEFLDGPNKSKLLTKDQKLSFLTNYHNTDSQQPLNLAEGLSVFSIKRYCGPLRCSCISPEFFCYMVNEPPHSAVFKSDSYVRLSSPITIKEHHDVVSFNLKTTSPDGLIISCGLTFCDYILIGVQSGKLHLEVNCGEMGIFKIESDKKVDDAQAHRISFIFRPSSIDMMLDHRIKTLPINYSHYSDDRWMIIGRNNYLSHARFKNGLNGCISSIFLPSLGRLVDFHTDHKEIWNVKACKCEFKK